MFSSSWPNGTTPSTAPATTSITDVGASAAGSGPPKSTASTDFALTAVAAADAAALALPERSTSTRLSEAVSTAPLLLLARWMMPNTSPWAWGRGLGQTMGRGCRQDV